MSRISITDFSRQWGPYHIFVAGPAIISGFPFGFYSPNVQTFPGHTHLYDVNNVASALQELAPFQLNYATYVLS